MPKKTEVATTEKKEMTVPVSNANVPEHLREYANMGALGFEHVSSKDTIIPRLAIAQAISPQVTKGDPLRIDGLEVGQFFNTVTQEIYGDKIYITPLLEFPSRTLFPPRGSDEGPLCSTRKLDENGRLVEGPITPEGCDMCPHSKWLDVPRPDGSTKPECTFFYNYPMAVHSEGGLDPVIFSVKSKMLKSAKRLNSLIRYRKPQLPGFCCVLELTTRPEKAKIGTFFNLVVNNPNPEEFSKDVPVHLIDQTKKLYYMMETVDLDKVDMRGVDKEEEPIEDESVPF